MQKGGEWVQITCKIAYILNGRPHTSVGLTSCNSFFFQFENMSLPLLLLGRSVDKDIYSDQSLFMSSRAKGWPDAQGGIVLRVSLDLVMDSLYKPTNTSRTCNELRV